MLVVGSARVFGGAFALDLVQPLGVLAGPVRYSLVPCFGGGS